MSLRDYQRHALETMTRASENTQAEGRTLRTSSVSIHRREVPVVMYRDDSGRPRYGLLVAPSVVCMGYVLNPINGVSTCNPYVSDMEVTVKSSSMEYEPTDG